MNRRCGAGLVGQPRRAGRIEDDDLVAGSADRLDDQRLGRARYLHHRVDMLVLEPIAGDGRGAVGAALMIGGDDLDRRAQHLAAEILARHLRRDRAALAGELGIGAGHVEDEPDLAHPIRDPGRGAHQRCGGDESGGAGGQQSALFHEAPVHNGLLSFWAQYGSS